jgi:hypothetical protein
MGAIAFQFADKASRPWGAPTRGRLDEAALGPPRGRASTSQRVYSNRFGEPEPMPLSLLVLALL